MARAESRPHGGLRASEGPDDVEKSLELLDKVLSEFEDLDSLPPIVEPESPSQGHQSEDDGYMSMNGRRTKFALGFQPTDEIAPPLSPADASRPLPVPPDEKTSPPPPPEEAERIISNLLPSVSPSSAINLNLIRKEFAEPIRWNKFSSSTVMAVEQQQQQQLQLQQQQQQQQQQRQQLESTIGVPYPEHQPVSYDERRRAGGGDQIADMIPSQTTLPKARPQAVLPCRYASLPSSSPPRLLAAGLNANGSAGAKYAWRGSDDKSSLVRGGIGISAVHDAVLRGGVARLPDTIVNEHPVTIYPGRASPSRRGVPPRTLPGSIERHREVCRKNVAANEDDDVQSGGETMPLAVAVCHVADVLKSPSMLFVSQKNLTNINLNMILNNNGKNGGSGSGSRSNNANHAHSHGHSHGHNRTQQHLNQNNHRMANSDDDFSDDSLEETSLPPPPPPPIVPPPPSLSAPVTPSKRSSIAWEINLDDPLADECGNGSGSGSGADVDGMPVRKQTPSSNKMSHRRRGRSVSGSQSSLASTPGQSTGSNRPITTTGSGEWPDPPEPPICSTEDEAASIYSDSDEIAPYPPNLTGLGTYVIRKGRKQRQRVPDMVTNDDSPAMSPVNSRSALMSGYNHHHNGNNHNGHHLRHQFHHHSDMSVASNGNGNGNGNSVAVGGGIMGLPSPVYPPSLTVPNSRHSIDLGSPSMSGNGSGGFVGGSGSGYHVATVGAASAFAHNSLNSPRSRLSLDLSSPTSELPSLITNGTANGNANNAINVVAAAAATTTTAATTIISPRYSEFKTYSSTFDGLQALDASCNGLIMSASNCNLPNMLLNGTGGVSVANGNVTAMAIANATAGGSSQNINGIGVASAALAPSAGAIGAAAAAAVASSSTINGMPLMRVASLPAITPPLTGPVDVISTPRRELAPPLEEDEEQDSETQRGAPLRQIENNISALLRGDIAVARVGDIPPPRRPLGFRPGVHKSESAKEMLLSQINLGPLPPSPPSSSPEMESDGFPPLPPSPRHETPELPMHGGRVSSRNRINFREGAIGGADMPPAIPPHKGNAPSLNTLKTRSMDAGFSKSYRNGPFASTSPHGPAGTLPPELPGAGSSRRRLMSGAFPKRSAQSPREERRLQTSCSLPETPIFARGCDIPRTPHRRAPELPGTGSRTAPRTTTTSSLNSSIVGIGSTIGAGGRQRQINHALASGEMLRLAGGPARGWYPKQRHPRPASTENLDRLHPQGSIRAWDAAVAAGTTGRKPLTLPPNLTPKFFNKSPREALRRVTSLLIRKGTGGHKETKESKRDKEKEQRAGDGGFASPIVLRSPGAVDGDQHHRSGTIGSTQSTTSTSLSGATSVTTSPNAAAAAAATSTTAQHKKKGFFKSFWKKSKHYSLEH